VHEEELLPAHTVSLTRCLGCTVIPCWHTHRNDYSHLSVYNKLLDFTVHYSPWLSSSSSSSSCLPTRLQHVTSTPTTTLSVTHSDRNDNDGRYLEQLPKKFDHYDEALHKIGVLTPCKIPFYDGLTDYYARIAP